METLQFQFGPALSGRPNDCICNTVKGPIKIWISLDTQTAVNNNIKLPFKFALVYSFCSFETLGKQSWKIKKEKECDGWATHPPT